MLKLKEQACTRTSPLKSFMLPAAVIAGALVALLRNDARMIDLVYFGFAAVAVGVVGQAMVDKQGNISGLDLHNPRLFYGAFFALYYPIPLALFAADPWLPKHNLAYILMLIVLGFGGFWIGIGAIRKPKAGSVSPSRIFSALDARAMLLLCCVGFVLVLTHYGYLISIGQFYTHAQYFEQEPTIAASFLNVFAGAFKLPLVLMFAMLIGVADKKVSDLADKLFHFYTAFAYVACLISSQFRMSLTVLMLFLLGRKLAGKAAIKVRHVVVVAVLGAASLIVIQATRKSMDVRVATTENQLFYSLQQTTEAFGSFFDGSTHGIGNPGSMNETNSRATWPLVFLSNIVDAIDSGRDHLGGATINLAFTALIPRVLWPEKPTITSTQIFIEQKLRMREIDASPAPVTQLYAEWGALGVFLGMFVFGVLMAALTYAAVRQKSVILWVTLIWVWMPAIQVETELIQGVLVALRNLCVVIVMFFLLRGIAYLFFRPPRMRFGTNDVFSNNCYPSRR